MPKASGAFSAAAATKTAAKPTRLWKAATSCGIAVMAMRRAMVAPMVPPMAMPPMMSPQLKAPSGPATPSVVAMAMAMPIMP